MINLFKNLQAREIRLIVIAFVLLLILAISFSVSNLYSTYNFSLKKVSKEKSDYEYVYKRAQLLNEPILPKTIIESRIAFIIKVNSQLNEDITNVILSQKGTDTNLSFTATNLKSSIIFIEKVNDSSSLSPKNINYKLNDQSIRASVKFN